MPTFVSPTGNPEIWEEKPPGYITQEEWEQQQEAKAREEEARRLVTVPPSVWEEQKADEIRWGAQEALTRLSRKYPERDVITFAQQEKEARAFLADASSPAPLIREIADSRSVTVAELAAKIVANADVYAVKAGKIIGHRQYLMEQLAVAKESAENAGNSQVIKDIVVSYNFVFTDTSETQTPEV